jgi:hypothetical protein
MFRQRPEAVLVPTRVWCGAIRRTVPLITRCSAANRLRLVSRTLLHVSGHVVHHPPFRMRV